MGILQKICSPNRNPQQNAAAADCPKPSCRFSPSEGMRERDCKEREREKGRKEARKERKQGSKEARKQGRKASKEARKQARLPARQQE